MFCRCAVFLPSWSCLQSCCRLTPSYETLDLFLVAVSSSSTTMFCSSSLPVSLPPAHSPHLCQILNVEMITFASCKLPLLCGGLNKLTDCCKRITVFSNEAGCLWATSHWSLQLRTASRSSRETEIQTLLLRMHTAGITLFLLLICPTVFKKG